MWRVANEAQLINKNVGSDYFIDDLSTEKRIE